MTNTNATDNAITVDHSSNVNGNNSMLCALDKDGCLNIAVVLRARTLEISEFAMFEINLRFVARDRQQSLLSRDRPRRRFKIVRDDDDEYKQNHYIFRPRDAARS